MAHLRRSVSESSPSVSLALALGAGLCLAVAPRVALAEPDDDELELGDDEDEEDPLDDEGEEDPLDDEEAPGASGSASGSASVSLGGGGKAEGKDKGKRGKKAKAPKKKDDRPFFERYGPTNHMLNAGASIGAFWRADNHGLFDRSLGERPDTQRTNFDVNFHLEYMVLPYVGVAFEGGAMPTNSTSIMGGAKGNFYTVRGHVVGALPYRLTPTLALGGGLMGLRSAEPILNGADPAFHWGPGAKFYVNEWIAVRVDGRHMVSSRVEGNRVHHGELLFGAEVTIRLTKWVGAKWRAQRSDRDGDTIADFYDECPDEWGDGDNGCPLDRDTDRDGIKDKSDRCPNEWGDGPDGCPVPDKDGDGILDLDDNCEDEPEVYNGIDDEDGCPDDIPEEVKQFEGVLKGIYFDTGESTIRKRSYPALKRVVTVLEKYPGLKVEISGHTDSKGSEEDNLQLSQERADAVKQYMVDEGIDGSRITTRGAGPNEPIADNKTKKGRQQNRRIEFKIQ